MKKRFTVFFLLFQGVASDHTTSCAPFLVAGGFGGSATRQITQILASAGINMGDRDNQTEDSLLMRRCKADMPSYFFEAKRPLIEASEVKEWTASNILLSSVGAWNNHTKTPRENGVFHCLSEMITKTACAKGAVFGLKEPRIMYQLPLMIYGIGARHYVHIVRDLRTMHHFHIEHFPKNWIDLMGGWMAFGAELQSAFDRVSQLPHVSMPVLAECSTKHDGLFQSHLGEGNSTCGFRIAFLEDVRAFKCGDANNCHVEDQVTHRLSFAVGWNWIVTALARAVALGDSGPWPWLHIIRVETLWDKSTCPAAITDLMREIGLENMASKNAKAWYAHCGSSKSDSPSHYAAPNPEQPFGNNAALKVKTVTAIARPSLTALGYIGNAGPKDNHGDATWRWPKLRGIIAG